MDKRCATRGFSISRSQPRFLGGSVRPRFLGSTKEEDAKSQENASRKGLDSIPKKSLTAAGNGGRGRRGSAVGGPVVVSLVLGVRGLLGRRGCCGVCCRGVCGFPVCRPGCGRVGGVRPRGGPHNQLLVGCKRPDATYVRGFKSWIGNGRVVRKGEKSIAIYAPRPWQ
jgi:hypothetical protein